MVVGDAVTFGYGVQLDDVLEGLNGDEQKERDYEGISQGGAAQIPISEKRDKRHRAIISCLVILAFN